MAKRKTRSGAPAPAMTAAIMREQSSMFLEESIDLFQKEYGDPNIAMVGEAGKIVIGVPINYLAFEYMIQNSVLPLSRVMVIVGLEGTFKSALNFEFARWFRRYGGISMLFENESKYSPDQAMSIIGWDDPKAMGHVPCTSLEDWQEKMQLFIGRIKERMIGNSKKRGTGRSWPVFMCLDSLMGKLSESTTKDIEDDGHSGRRFAYEAMMNTDFVKKIASDILRLPITWSMVNHLKKSTDQRGIVTRGKAGGKLVNFQETFELELARGFKFRNKIVGDEKSGRPTKTIRNLDIRCYKNSLGETDREINVDIAWWYEHDPDTGLQRQVSQWDWYGSAIKLIEKFEGYEAKRLRNIVDINKKTRSDKRIGFWSASLGVPESEPMLASELGEILHKNDEIMHALRLELGIKMRKEFIVGQDYLKQIAKLRTEAKIAVNGKAALSEDAPVEDEVIEDEAIEDEEAEEVEIPDES